MYNATVTTDVRSIDIVFKDVFIAAGRFCSKILLAVGRSVLMHLPVRFGAVAPWRSVLSDQA